MMLDIQRQSGSCCKNGCEQVKLRSDQSNLKLFTAASSLGYVAIYILGPLPKAWLEHKFIVVITDRFYKLSRAVPMKKVGILEVCKVILDHWL